MSLDEEIAIYQFGQGILSADDLSNHFSQLDAIHNKVWLYDFSLLIGRLNLTDDELDQAMSNPLPGPLPMPSLLSYIDRLRKKTRIQVYTSELVGSLIFMLQLFKTGYQRRYALEKENPTHWWYRDLSNDETIRNIHTAHQELVEKAYANPSFRTEFTILAKHWHEHYTGDKNKLQVQEPEPAPQSKFNFLSYDEIISLSVNLFDHRNAKLYILRHSVEKALSKMYHIQPQQAGQLILDVIDRHLRDTYNTSLY